MDPPFSEAAAGAATAASAAAQAAAQAFAVELPGSEIDSDQSVPGSPSTPEGPCGPLAHVGDKGAPFSGEPCCHHLYRLFLLHERSIRRRSTRSLGRPEGPRISHFQVPGGGPEAGRPEDPAAAAVAETAAVEAAIRGSLWEQGITPLRTMMEKCSASLSRGPPQRGPLGPFPGPPVSGIAAATCRRSRTSSLTSAHGGLEASAAVVGTAASFGAPQLGAPFRGP